MTSDLIKVDRGWGGVVVRRANGFPRHHSWWLGKNTLQLLQWRALFGRWWFQDTAYHPPVCYYTTEDNKSIYNQRSCHSRSARLSYATELIWVNAVSQSLPIEWHIIDRSAVQHGLQQVICVYHGFGFALTLMQLNRGSVAVNNSTRSVWVNVSLQGVTDKNENRLQDAWRWWLKRKRFLFCVLLIAFCFLKLLPCDYLWRWRNTYSTVQKFRIVRCFRKNLLCSA